MNLAVIRHLCVALLIMTLSDTVAANPPGKIGYLGPAGSWTHQACLDLYGPDELVPLDREALFSAYDSGKIERACVPVTTSAVGITPYLDAVLDLPEVQVVAEYPKMLGYSLLARPGTRREDIRQVYAHPVAFEEVKPWLDKEMPTVARVASTSGGAAAQTVAQSGTHDSASFGPKIGGTIYGLVSLADGIEQGPQNVTRWWVLGKTMPAPTGHDKTSLLVEVADEQLSSLLSSFANAGIQVLTIYERPSKKTLDTHRYLIEVAGHAHEGALKAYLPEHKDIRVLGSYARRY